MINHLPQCELIFYKLSLSVKGVLSSHSSEAQTVAAEGRWLLRGGKYLYKIKVREHFVWLLKVTTNTGMTVFSCSRS